MDDRRDRDDGLPYGRRRRTAASALVAILVAFVLGALFNAPAMQKTALELPFGAERSFRLALLDPLATVSHWLFLDRPAQLTAQALGKPEPGPTGAPAPWSSLGRPHRRARAGSGQARAGRCRRSRCPSPTRAIRCISTSPVTR